MFFKKKKYIVVEEKKKNNTLINIVTIISITLATIKAIYYGLIEPQIGLLILIGAVILIALGTSITKILVAAISVYVFYASASQGNIQLFERGMLDFFGIIVVVLAIYWITKKENNKFKIE